jgi:hypothetical protein
MTVSPTSTNAGTSVQMSSCRVNSRKGSPRRTSVSKSRTTTTPVTTRHAAPATTYAVKVTGKSVGSDMQGSRGRSPTATMGGHAPCPEIISGQRQESRGKSARMAPKPTLRASPCVAAFSRSLERYALPLSLACLCLGPGIPRIRRLTVEVRRTRFAQQTAYRGLTPN